MDISDWSVRGLLGDQADDLRGVAPENGSGHSAVMTDSEYFERLEELEGREDLSAVMVKTKSMLIRFGVACAVASKLRDALYELGVAVLRGTNQLKEQVVNPLAEQLVAPGEMSRDTAMVIATTAFAERIVNRSLAEAFEGANVALTMSRAIMLQVTNQDADHPENRPEPEHESEGEGGSAPASSDEDQARMNALLDALLAGINLDPDADTDAERGDGDNDGDGIKF